MWRPDLDDLVPPTRWPELTLRQYIAIGILAIALSVLAAGVWAQGAVFSDAECKALAHFARTSAEIRDLEAKLEKHVALVRRRVAEGGMRLSPLLERELRRVYAEGLEPDNAEDSAHTRCMTGEILRREG
jgi:hypothetical protein